MRNRIALKLFLYFAAALVAFAAVSGVLFQTLFTRQTLETKKAEMLERATSLAGTLSGLLNENGNQMMQGGGYGAYARLLGVVEANIWVLDENLQFLSQGHMMGRTITYSDLPADAEALVQQVFQGKTPFSEGFSDLLGTPTLTVGAPIMQGDTVAGALLLHDAVSGIRAASSQGIRISLLSGAAALLLSVVLAAMLSLSFARPLDRMSRTALRLTGGDYAAKTGVARNDEIGRLAHALDGLSAQLDEARKAAERQNQLRQDFFANVSHELRTPVAVLRGSLEALCDGVVQAPAQMDEYHRQMLGETLSLQRLVNDLMEWSRLQNTDFPIERNPVLLNDILADALRSAQLMAEKKGVLLTSTVADQPIGLQGDYGRLKQMFLIVLDNAVKFTPAGGRVDVALSPGCVSITDTGIGIPTDELPFIFDRFRKARTEENRLGSGLGLGIAKQIALRHGMRIEADSTPGQGSTFRFLWDVKEPQTET